MSDPLRIGIAGLGTVGAGVAKLLADNAGLIAARAGRPLAVAAVSARSRDKDRGVDLSAAHWFEDPVAMAGAGQIDLFVELIGGDHGPAKQAVEAALAAGKPVVTANKALIAAHGSALARLASASGAALAFEAAVAGGIPALKALREGLSANRIREVHGILNGTCNYILTEMRETGRDFAEVLAEAQALGYAEADPGFDVDGIDAAHKLAILAALAFGTEISFSDVSVEGIREVSALDIELAGELGHRIKLLGITRATAAGIEQRVHPCLVPETAQIASVEGVFNAVVADGDFVDQVVLIGRGAGAGPTASAVVADLIDIAAGRAPAPFGIPVGAMQPLNPAPISERHGAYYLRLMVLDQPGVIADIAAILRNHDVSVRSMLQRGRDPGQPVPVVLTTHETREASMQRAIAEMADLAAVTETPRMIRIEKF